MPLAAEPPPDDYAPFDYAAVTADAIAAGCDGAIARAERLVEALLAIPEARRTFANTLGPLEEIDDVLNHASGHYGFLSQVAPDAASTIARPAPHPMQCVRINHPPPPRLASPASRSRS